MIIDKSSIIPFIAHIDELPKILLNDPISRYFGFQVGDVIKIIRHYDNINLLNQDDIGYRVVVNHNYQ